MKREGLLKYGFVAPAILLLLAFNVFPLFYNIVISFTDMNLSGGEWKWVGSANYGDVFTEADYASAIRKTALFVVAVVAVELLLGFVLALALQEKFSGKTAVLTILLVPMMLSPAVMGLFWGYVLNSQYGILNLVLDLLGLPQPQWLPDPQLRFVSIMAIDVWMWTPFMMLIALAALNSIPRYIYEAAEIDRASRWTVFRRITLPMCAPLLFLAVLLRTTDALKQFDLVMALSGPVEPSTQTLSALLYQTAFRGFRLGLGSAYGFAILVAVIALATIYTRYIDRIQRQQAPA